MTPAKPPKSPLEQSQDAKSNRDLHTEVAALMDGESALTSAPWYPPLAGDIISVHFEPTPSTAAFTEVYTVTAVGRGQTLLEFTGAEPADHEFASMSGAYAGPLCGDGLMEMWMEAGPARLSVRRGGELVHDGPSAWR
jgi:hypothetical protein